MDIYIQDRTTGRVIKSTDKQLKMLGPNFRRVAAPRTPAPKAAKEPEKAKVQEPEIKELDSAEQEEQQEMTRQEYLNALKDMGVKKKGLHLYNIDKLKALYDESKE